MNICIGIISYLPDDQKIREARKTKLVSLLQKCDELFSLPTVIIAQNWHNGEIEFPATNWGSVYYYDKLGITGARKELRKVFLEKTNYDYLIMLDDDCELIGTKEGADDYIKQIEMHPNMAGLFRDTLLKLFAISKDMFQKVGYEDGEPTKGEIFEDKLFVNKLKLKYPDKIFNFKRHYQLDERSNNYNDEYSTWYYGQYDKRLMGDRTREILGRI